MRLWTRVVWILATVTLAALLAVGTTAIGPRLGYYVQSLLTHCDYNCYEGVIFGGVGGFLLGLFLSIVSVILSFFLYTFVKRAMAISQAKEGHD